MMLMWGLFLATMESDSVRKALSSPESSGESSLVFLSLNLDYKSGPGESGSSLVSVLFSFFQP